MASAPICPGRPPRDPRERQLSLKCIVCRHSNTHEGTTTVTFHREGRTLVVNEVPAEVCENCGEAYVAEDVTAELLRIASEARQAHAIVLIRDYPSLAA
ncbi:MAG: type II toxin-antitoxin system MqsA family antitoxin [Pseudonocardiaceae bacterium]